MATEQENDNNNSGGISWGKVLAGAAMVAGALVGYAVFSPQISSALQSVTGANDGFFHWASEFVKNTGESLRNGMASTANFVSGKDIAHGYKPENFQSILGTTSTVHTGPGLANITETKGLLGVTKEIGESAVKKAGVHWVITGAAAVGVGAAGYAGKKWVERVGSRPDYESQVARIEAERAQGPVVPGRA